MKMNISNPLNWSLNKTKVTQKSLAFDTGLSKATINNYVAGGNVRPNEAVDIANVLRESDFSMEMGNMMLGLLKAFNGDAFYHRIESFDAFDTKEEREEKEAYERYDVRTLLNSPHLTAEQVEHLRKYSDEKLDSVVMGMTYFAAIAEALGTTPMDLFRERMPYYKAQHYMKGDDPTWEG